VVAVAAPSNYDDAGMLIRVDPNSLYQYATGDMMAHGQVIMDAINNIVQTWNNLQVSWVSNSASEAQDFFDRWNSAVTQLFGTNADANSGALPKIADGVDLASINYGEAEDTVTKMFNSLTAGLDMGAIAGAVTADTPSDIAPLTVGQAPTRTPPATPAGQTPDPVTESAPAPGSTR
jgi:uncharacterized protein YukE